MTRTLVLLGVAAAAAAGCMGDDDDQRVTPGLVQKSEAHAARVRIEGGSPGQRRLLRSILTGVGRTGIRHVEVTGAGDWGSPRGVEVRFESKPQGDLRAGWEERLVAGVFRDRSAELGLPKVIAVSSATLKEGSRIELSRSRAFRPFMAVDAAAVSAGVDRAAERSGAELERAELLQPHGLAVAIRLRVVKPARFLSKSLGTFFEELDEDAARYEGRYLEVVDSRNRTVLEEFGASRVHWGGGGPSEPYEGCVFLGLSRPIGYDPPPCPIED
jgi:hypothetical protein